MVGGGGGGGEFCWFILFVFVGNEGGGVGGGGGFCWTILFVFVGNEGVANVLYVFYVLLYCRAGSF